jgi:hypothetical protein
VDWRKSELVSKPSELGNTVHWRINKHFVDMLVVVSRGIGLGALLPNVTSDVSWEFYLDVMKNPRRDFGMQHAKLGFNPSERMLWVGETHMSEDVWIAMVPNSFGKDNSDTPMLGGLEDGRKQRTCLTEHHRRILLAFLAYAASRAVVGDIYMFPTYPDVEDDDNFLRSSNLL